MSQKQKPGLPPCITPGLEMHQAASYNTRGINDKYNNNYITNENSNDRNIACVIEQKFNL